jgi:hypothetical protein
MRLVWLLLLALAGCESGGHMSHPDLGAAPDLAPALHLSIGATAGNLSLQGADFSVDGVGSNVVGSLSLQHGSGTVELNGKSVRAAVYEKQMFPAQNLRLYQALAVEETRLWVLWFYCDTMSPALESIYFEATDGTMVQSEPAMGNCQDTNMTSMVAAQFPPLDLVEPTLVDGYTIDGANVKLMGAQPGSVQLGTNSLQVFVFNTVDCRKGCGTPGWTELHSLLWDRAGARVCFAIFYLSEGDTSHVQLAYSLTLPTLDDPAGNVLLPATWTRP